MPVTQQPPASRREVIIYRKRCAYCGAEFEGGARAKYCSQAHGRAASREKNPEKARE